MSERDYMLFNGVRICVQDIQMWRNLEGYSSAVIKIWLVGRENPVEVHGYAEDFQRAMDEAVS